MMARLTRLFALRGVLLAPKVSSTSHGSFGGASYLPSARHSVASARWSNPNNWSPVGTPQPNDDLTFAFGGASMFNDLVGLTVRDLDFGPGQWQLTGNELLITRGIQNALNSQKLTHNAAR